MSQPRAPSKVLNIVKCFCKSTTLHITKKMHVGYENRVVHAWCTLGPLSIVLYLSDYTLVDSKYIGRSVLEL